MYCAVENKICYSGSFRIEFSEKRGPYKNLSPIPDAFWKLQYSSIFQIKIQDDFSQIDLIWPHEKVRAQSLSLILRCHFIRDEKWSHPMISKGNPSPPSSSLKTRSHKFHFALWLIHTRCPKEFFIKFLVIDLYDMMIYELYV